MFTLTQQPIWIDAMAHYPYNEGLESSLKFVSNYGDTVSMGVRYGNNLAVPRRLAPPPPDGKDLRSANHLGAINCKFPPRSEDQAKAIARSIELLKQDVSHVIEAPTGWGKTYVGCAVAAAMGEATLIVCTKQDLMDSWHQTLVKLIGVSPSDIGIAQADKLKYKGKRFVLGMVQSLAMEGKYDDDFFRHFGLVLFDETHRMAADSFSRVCQYVHAKYRVGLSATPKRGDGKTPVIQSHIGPVLVKGVDIPMEPKILTRETGWSIPSYVKNYSPGKMMGVFNAMANDAKRNALIVQFIGQCHKMDRHVVVMADTIQHLKNLALMAGQVVPGQDIDFYIGERSKPELEIAAQKKVVMATYGMCAEGTNYPVWDALVCANPRANVKQPLGRILRSMEGKRQPVALDLVDNNSILRSFYLKRLKQYYEVKATIVKV